MNLNDERTVRRDRMRFIKNTQSSSLCYLGILFNVFNFVRLYMSDVGNYYYTIVIGVSIVYNLIFMLAVFLASEGVKNYKPGYSYLLAVIGVIQIVRIFIIPVPAHAAETLVNGVETTVMGNGQFMFHVVCLVASAVCLILSAVINFTKCRELAAHMKTLDAQNA